MYFKRNLFCPFAVFYVPKDGLSHTKRPPFGARKAAFRKPLSVNMLQRRKPAWRLHTANVPGNGLFFFITLRNSSASKVNTWPSTPTETTRDPLP